MKKLFNKIKKTVALIWGKVEKLWKRMDAEAREHIVDVIRIVQAVKEITQKDSLTGNLLDLIATKIPGAWDNLALAGLRKILPNLLIKLTYANVIINAGTTEEQLVKAIEIIRVFDQDQKEVFWDGFAKQLLKYSSDGILDWKDVNALIKWVYDKRYWEAS